MLTSKQEQFCKNIVSGMTKQEAYLSAYDSTSKTSASIEATKLLKREDITSYIQTLKKPIINVFENECISARKKQLDEIDKRIQVCKQNNDETNLRQYIEMKNKIYGLYKDTNEDEKHENTLNTIDTDTLKAIVTSA